MKTRCLFIILLSYSIHAQQMETGFSYLENGNWSEAVTFFEDILEEFPNNKTATICYARAIGLSGKEETASAVFKNMLTTYPNDFEIELNYAESLLWNKKYKEAEDYYTYLVAKDPLSFPAVLGMANTYSNQNKYDLALQFITKALQIDATNLGALISKKYIQLGKAQQYAKDNDSASAIALLQKNFDDFPKDIETLQVLAELYLSQKQYSNATEMYETMQDSVLMNRGLSLVAHQTNKEKKALQFARKGYEYAVSNDSTQYLLASERYVQALIWKSNYTKAARKIEQLEQLYPNHKTVLSLKATLGMYTAKFKNSIEQYQVILAKDSTSFDGNLGIANAFRAQGEHSKSMYYAEKTLQFYPGQKDATVLIQTLKRELLPQVQIQGAMTVDNGSNTAWFYGANITIPFTERFKAFASYGYRTTTNKEFETMANSNEVSLGGSYRIIHNVKVNGALSWIKADATTQNYTDVNGAISIEARPLPNQYLSLGYKRELQNFNANLIDEKIFMNNFNVAHNLGTNFGLGWYTSYSYTPQTDGNKRNLLFTSLYYNFSKRPAIKGGVNYQYMQFSEQVPELYFSPSNYSSLEVFAEANGSVGAFSYAINSALGKQFVENDPGSSLFRIEAKAAVAVAQNVNASIYGKYSNIASAIASGFSFTEIGIQLRWSIGKKVKRATNAE